MKTHMNDDIRRQLLCPFRRHFLEGSESIDFHIERKATRYRWIQHTLVRFSYLKLSKSEKGLISCYIRKMTGYGPAQVKRLIRQFQQTGRLVRKHRTNLGFY